MTMFERQGYNSHSPYHKLGRHSGVRSPALPAASIHGSREAYDDVHRPSHMTATSTSRTHGTTASPLGGDFWDPHQPYQRSASRQPISAPIAHQSGDGNRPSLPSLRTILGENARSPSSAHQRELPLQAFPKEPSYDQSTYKPPALYPNKRTRTDSGWDGKDAERNPAESPLTTLPYMNNRQEDRIQQHRQYDLPTINSGNSEPYRQRRSDEIMDYRPRNGAFTSQHASPEDRGRPVQTQVSPRVAQPQNYEVQNRNSTYYHASLRPDSTREVHTPSAYESSGYTQSRSPSVHMIDDSGSRSSMYRHPGASNQAYTPDTRQHSLITASHNSGYPDEYASMNRSEGAQSYSGHPYPYPQAFFVPSHYEYQNGKSRKRSNLPKQSTEIMKRWFDDNLQNPYPSEEQKRHFALVAGINLTQVSNWFINHRRRCPELREKRDKGRAGSREDSI